VIEALPHVIREVPEAHLLILGRGPYEGDLYRLARQLGVSDLVTIKHIPPADREAMATALAEASVVAALSDYEANPVSVMEALYVERPVVGYDVAGVGEPSAARRVCRHCRPRARRSDVVCLAGGSRPATQLGFLRRPACAYLLVVAGPRPGKSGPVIFPRSHAILVLAVRTTRA